MIVNNMIYIDSVTKIYKNGEESLNDITLNIDRGEFLSVVGYSGAGKTTLLKLILGEEKPTKGSVYFDSINISKLSQRELNKYRRNIGVIFQDFRLISNKNVFENVAFTLQASGASEAVIGRDVPHVLELVGLKRKANSFPKELSGGEKQRVAIARAIVNNPDVIIADEPTGNLDPINTKDVIEILKKINSFGTTIILTTHEKGIVNDLKKRVITINEGEVSKDNKDGSYQL